MRLASLKEPRPIAPQPLRDWRVEGAFDPRAGPVCVFGIASLRQSSGDRNPLSRWRANLVARAPEIPHADFEPLQDRGSVRFWCNAQQPGSQKAQQLCVQMGRPTLPPTSTGPLEPDLLSSRFILALTLHFEHRQRKTNANSLPLPAN